MRKLLIALACGVLVYSSLPFSFAAEETVEAEKTAKGENDAWIAEFSEKDVDLSGLDEKTSKLVLKILNENDCTCGCEKDSIASCITHDKNCGYSRKLAGEIVAQARAGKTEKYLAGMLAAYTKDKNPPAKEPIKEDSQVYDISVDKSPWKGTKGAPVTILEFTDFECPYCARAAATMEQLMQAYPGQIILYVKNNPLPFHKNAYGAALASLAANEQGKYWELHDILFKNSRALTMENIHKFAEEIGLDMEQFKKSMENQELKDRIKADQAQARQVRATGTPAFFINGKKLSGAQPLNNFKKIVDEELAKLKPKPKPEN